MKRNVPSTLPLVNTTERHMGAKAGKDCKHACFAQAPSTDTAAQHSRRCPLDELQVQINSRTGSAFLRAASRPNVSLVALLSAVTLPVASE